MAVPTTSARLDGDEARRPAEAARREPDPDDPAAGLLELADAIEQRVAARAGRPTTAPRLDRPPPPARPRPPAAAPRRSWVWLVAVLAVVVGLVAIGWQVLGGDDGTDRVATGADDAAVPEADRGPAEGDRAPDVAAPDAEPGDAPEVDATAPDDPADAAPAPDRGDDEQDDVPLPGDGNADSEVTGDDRACEPDALLDAVGGSIDGREVTVVDHECDGDFALAWFRAVGEDPADVYVVLYRGEGPWDDRYAGRTLDCNAIVGQVQGFPTALCDAVP